MIIFVTQIVQLLSLQTLHQELVINVHQIVILVQIVLNAHSVPQDFTLNLLIFFVILLVKWDFIRTLHQELVILVILNVQHVLVLLIVLIVWLDTS